MPSFQMTEKINATCCDFPENADFDDLEVEVAFNRYSKPCLERFQNIYFTNFCIVIKIIEINKIWQWIFSSLIEYDPYLIKPEKYV
jgi:hypothetical protein